MITTIVRYKISCDNCKCTLNDEHLNNQFVDCEKMIKYASEGGWLIKGEKVLCDECRNILIGNVRNGDAK